MSDAPLLPAGHPQRHGFTQCARCGTWRKPTDIEEREWTWNHEVHGPIAMDGPVCINVAWCSEQAKACGRLEGV